MTYQQTTHCGRYVAYLGKRTIVRVYKCRGCDYLLCRDERTGRTTRLLPHRLWREAEEFEAWGDDSIQGYTAAQHREIEWIGDAPVIQAEMPEIEVVSIPPRSETRFDSLAHMRNQMYQIAIDESARHMMAGC